MCIAPGQRHGKGGGRVEGVNGEENNKGGICKTFNSKDKINKVWLVNKLNWILLFLTQWFHWRLKEIMIPILKRLCHKLLEKEMLPN